MAKVRRHLEVDPGLKTCESSFDLYDKKMIISIEKGNEEVKLTSDVYNRPPY